MKNQNTKYNHLGNIRLSYTKDPQTNVLKILEENHYYPFGLKHTNYSGGKKTILKETEIDPKRVGPSADDLYKYKYNGKEWQDELGLNFYDYGARNYDPTIGRWMNIDPLAENSRRWNPYNYAYNNPVYFVDPDGMQAIAGDDLILQGSESAIEKTKGNINEGLGGNYTEVDKNGKVSLNVSEEQINNFTSEQKALYETLNEAIDPSKSDVVINVVESSEDVFIGSYQNNTIDIDDINAFGDNKLSNKSAVLGHEVAEQTEKQRNDLGDNDFDRAHSVGKKAENNISGNMRMNETTVPTSVTTPNGTPLVTGKKEVYYYNNSAGSRQTLQVNIKRNNIIGIKVKNEKSSYLNNISLCIL